MTNILKVSQDGCVCVLTLNDPGRRNILSRAMCDAISSGIAAATLDESTKAIVVAAEGSSFCAGADLDDLIAASEGETVNIEAVYRSFMDVASCPLPVVAAVNGPAVGAGLNLALACDVRIASPEAAFDCRFLKIGLHPGGGHTWLLQRAVAWSEAIRMVLLGEKVDAADALRIGLAAATTSTDELLKLAVSIATRIASAPRDLIIRTKSTMREARSEPYLVIAERERVEQAYSLHQPEFSSLIGQMRESVKQVRR